jgi:EAL domain-containing protein (putative c-di-GMP-specific phosphodiesterase class I)
MANLVRLRLKGFGLAMDDYGVGYSSAQQLSSCPFTRLKIDRVFVDGASHRANRRAVLESSIQMGHRLSAETIGEGVESEADMAVLRELGCDYAQGFLIAKPMPGAELELWMQQRKSKDKQA